MSSTRKKIFVIFIIIISVIFMYYTKNIMKPILFSIFLAYILYPIVKFLHLKGINKKVSSLIIVLLIIGIFTFISIFVIPGIIKDAVGIIKNIDNYSKSIEKYILWFDNKNLPTYIRVITDKSIFRIQSSLINTLNGFLNSIFEFSSQLPTYILSPVFVYYFLSDSEYFLNIFKSIIPSGIREKTMELGHEMDNIIGCFIKTQIILSIVISILTFIALLILKIKYPLIIALVNGVANIIPYFGPLIGMLPAILIGLTESLNKAILVGVILFVIQEIESVIIAPKLMGESLGMHPVFIMLVLLLGGKFLGGWGLLLAIPLAGIINITYKYIIRNLY